MLKIIFEVDADDPLSVKESIAEYLEKHGDTRCVKVEQIAPQQLTFERKRSVEG